MMTFTFSLRSAVARTHGTTITHGAPQRNAAFSVGG